MMYPGHAPWDGIFKFEQGIVGQDFTTTVDQDGHFEVWLPGFSVNAGIEIEADILLNAVIFQDTDTQQINWCGIAGGRVSKPLEIDLIGTTFYGHRWQVGEAVPDPLYDACPWPVHQNTWSD